MSPLGESDGDTLDLTAAIDAAARGWWTRTTRSSVLFDDLSGHDQHTARALVLPIVAAAAPVIAEQVWDEGWQGGMTDMNREWMVPEIPERHTNPYRKQAPDD